MILLLIYYRRHRSQKHLRLANFHGGPWILVSVRLRPIIFRELLQKVVHQLFGIRELPRSIQYASFRGTQALGPLKIGEVRVGGNPAKPTTGWNYGSFFAVGCYRGYTGQQGMNSQVKVLPPLSDRHNIRVRNKGDMEAFLQMA